MLRFLRIRNLVVIEAVEVEFEPGFNVLTGETGAGKSILVEAVDLLLGGRATADLVRTGETHASIEGIFELAGDREVIVRRELTSQGRSRSFIDGGLATAGALRDLASHLVEIHGQHEQQALLDPLTHLPLVDECAKLTPLASAVSDAWIQVRDLREQLERTRLDAREKAARLDLIAFQLGEIDTAAPKGGEDEELATTRQVLAGAERILRLCEEGYTALYESDQAVLARLAGVWKRVGELAAVDPQFAPYVDARDNIKAQLEDLALFLRRYTDNVNASPARLQEVEDRLALLDQLKRKYGPTLQDVIDRGRALARERDLLSGSEARAEELERAMAEASARYLSAARELSENRHRAAIHFARRIETLVADLAMPATRFQVRFNAGELTPDKWSARGIDEAEFFMSPNLGEDLRPLTRIVSGGELSRVALAVKTLAVESGGHPSSTLIEATGAAALSSVARSPETLIFDEVDVGIGGKVADVIGARLRALGSRFQVLCITHLPQIAARATAQFRIEKTVRGRRTVTLVERLNGEARIEEIARMIGGSSTTAGVRASARELLLAGSEYTAKVERRKRTSAGGA